MRVGVRNIKSNKRNSSFIREMRVFTYYYLILSCKLPYAKGKKLSIFSDIGSGNILQNINAIKHIKY